MKAIFNLKHTIKNKSNLRTFCTTNNKGDKPGIDKTPSVINNKLGYMHRFRERFSTKEEKEKRMKLLKSEMINNPEFFNAFPHLKNVVDTENLEEKYKMDQTEDKKTEYFESLLYKHKGYENIYKTQDEINTENKALFSEGHLSPSGPIRRMSREEKEKIHLEIDEKMSQLEQTGLSKEEVLYNRPEGIPLANDHFFQYLKSNRIAREMLITADEPFNADRVIEIALKQDIGPDPSMGLTRKKNPKLKEDMPLSFELSQAKRTFDRKHLDETLKEDDFDYRTNYLDKLKVFLNAEKSRPVSFIRPPLMRSQIRKKYMIKTIKKSDVHWKNLPLLTRFINEAGKLMTRYQSRLPTSVHRKLAKTVKHARNMGLLPFNDFIKPEHKVPFTSIYTEFLHDTTKVVDQKTGTIKLVYLPTDKDKFSYENFGSATDSNKQNAKQADSEKFKDCLKLDRFEIPFTPDKEQKDLLVAHNYLLSKNDEDATDADNKQSYENIKDLVSKKLSSSNLIEAFMNERAYDMQELKSLAELPKPDIPKMKVKEQIKKVTEEIDALITKHGIDKLKALDYQDELKDYQNNDIEPKMKTKSEQSKLSFSRY